MDGPSDTAAPTLAIGAALRWELQAVLRALRRRCDDGTWHADPATWSARVGATQVRLYRTGVGVKAARSATRRLLRRHRISLVLNTGCAGGLSPALGPGDIIVAERLLATSPSHQVIAVAPSLQRTLERVGGDDRFRVATGTLLTSRKPLATRGEKAEAAQLCAADAVEMEGIGVAEASADFASDFASVRAVIDPAAADLPLLSLWATAGPSPLAPRPPLRALLSVQQMMCCVELLRNKRRASTALEHFHDALFAALQAGTIDLDLFSLR